MLTKKSVLLKKEFLDSFWWIVPWECDQHLKEKWLYLRFQEIEEDDSRIRIDLDLANSTMTDFVLGVKMEKSQNQSCPLKSRQNLINETLKNLYWWMPFVRILITSCWLNEVVEGPTVGMFDWSYFDNSKVIMFDDWKVSFLRKKIVSIHPNS